MSAFVSRGFQRRHRSPDGPAERLPPGQYLEPGFQVLTAGPTPRIDTDVWGFRIDGMMGQGSAILRPASASGLGAGVELVATSDWATAAGTHHCP
jgi:hypothetical protein